MKKQKNNTKTSKRLSLPVLLLCIVLGLLFPNADWSGEKEAGEDAYIENEVSIDNTADTDEKEAEQPPQLAADGRASQSTCLTSPESIPEYSGEDVITLNNNIPNFTDWDIANITGENYSELDRLGRCGPAVVMLEPSMQPTGERDSISHIKPTGWKQKKYSDLVDTEPPYIYNRSHLIAYALAAEDDNELNLITGTRHMNYVTMLPWEEEVMRYIDDTGNRVLYRVTPYFAGDELLARGVEMEAYSVEDEGAGICYHVFVYNVHPGVEFDYATGENRRTE